MHLKWRELTLFAVIFSLMSLLYANKAFAGSWTVEDMDRMAAEDVALSSGTLTYDQKTHTFTDTRIGVTATLDLKRQGYFTNEDYKMLTEGGIAVYRDYRTGGTGRFDEKRKAIVWVRYNEILKQTQEIEVGALSKSSLSADFDFILNPTNLEKREERILQIQKQGTFTSEQFSDFWVRGMRLVGYILSTGEGENRIKLLKTLFLHPLALNLEALIDPLIETDPEYGFDLFLHVLIHEPWSSYPKTPMIIKKALEHHFQQSKFRVVDGFLEDLFISDLNMDLVRPTLMHFAETSRLRLMIETASSRNREILEKFISFIEPDMPLHAHAFRKAIAYRKLYEGPQDLKRMTDHYNAVIDHRHKIIEEILSLNSVHCVNNLTDKAAKKTIN